MNAAGRIGALVTVSSVVAILNAGIAQAQTTTSSPEETTSPSISTSDTTSAPSSSSAVELPDEDECALVQFVAVNGTTDSSKNSHTDADTGWMARIVQPTVQAANKDGETRMSRTYVPYPASFGGFVPSEDQASYAESVTTGVENGKKLIAEAVEKCPDTKIFLAGYSQGAQVASAIARSIGAGEGPVEPEALVGAALMSDPTRAQGAPIFQDAADRTTPAAVPGTDGEAVSAVNATRSAPEPEGRGISPNTAAPDFGSVADRVASFCVSGDLACDTPPGSDVLQVVANIAGQGEGSDPIQALLSTANVAGQSVLFTGAETILEDIEYSDGGGFTIAPATQGNTVLSRMARYSDPTSSTPPKNGTEMLVEAGTKLAGMALGASITVAKEVLTPATIAEVALAGAVNPGAAAAVLAGKVAVSATALISPTTVESGIDRVIGEIEHTVTDSTGLVDLATETETWKAIDAHGMYDKTPFSTTGQSPAALTQQWALAAASDLSVAHGMDALAPSASVSDTDSSSGANRMDQIKSGSGGDQITQLAASAQKADSSALTEALASVTA